MRGGKDINKEKERIVENVVERMKMMKGTLSLFFGRVLKASSYSHEVKLTDSTILLFALHIDCLFCIK